MDPVNVITHGQFVEHTSNGEVWSLQGVEWLIYEEFADGFDGRYGCRQL